MHLAVASRGTVNVALCRLAFHKKHAGEIAKILELWGVSDGNRNNADLRGRPVL